MLKMSQSKFFLYVFLGVIFWFNAAMIIRFMGKNFLTENNPKLILAFLLTFPVTGITFYVTKLVTKLAYSELLRPIVIMTFTATFLDGIALTWYRQLYSTSFEVALHGSALILWAVGLGLLFAYYLEMKGVK
jgi:hypothetical protein